MNLKRKIDNTQDLIEKALKSEFMRGEQRRTQALAFFFAAAIPLTVLHYWLFRERDYLHSAQFAYALVALCGLLGELGSWLILRRMQRRGQPAWEAGRYLNALFEMSIPTLALVLSAQTISAERVLGSPASQAYLLLILMGISQLGIRICVFRGVVAALEYQFFVVYLTHLLGSGPLQTSLSMGEPSADVMIYLSSGIAAGIVAWQLRQRFLNSTRQLINSHQELIESYETTIEGWSHALDLRDKETEGHSLRVAEMTLRMARLGGIHSNEQAHLRRGALLHDIGKIGIPDVILHKPGQLSPEEWEIMRRHPSLAYELLSPIAYLRPALDIPYCHHEKWDGSGYPRGLKNTDIPLGARMFSVVDVWDALTSQRPYHEAWPEERAREYILLRAGSEFDPQAVTLFIRALDEKKGGQGDAVHEVQPG